MELIKAAGFMPFCHWPIAFAAPSSSAQGTKNKNENGIGRPAYRNIAYPISAYPDGPEFDDDDGAKKSALGPSHAPCTMPYYALPVVAIGGAPVP
jgi:hypothetical protein